MCPSVRPTPPRSADRTFAAGTSTSQQPSIRNESWLQTPQFCEIASLGNGPSTPRTVQTRERNMVANVASVGKLAAACLPPMYHHTSHHTHITWGGGAFCWLSHSFK